MGFASKFEDEAERRSENAQDKIAIPVGPTRFKAKRKTIEDAVAGEKGRVQLRVGRPVRPVWAPRRKYRLLKGKEFRDYLRLMGA